MKHHEFNELYTAFQNIRYPQNRRMLLVFLNVIYGCDLVSNLQFINTTLVNSFTVKIIFGFKTYSIDYHFNTLEHNTFTKIKEDLLPLMTNVPELEGLDGLIINGRVGHNV